MPSRAALCPLSAAAWGVSIARGEGDDRDSNPAGRPGPGDDAHHDSRPLSGSAEMTC